MEDKRQEPTCAALCSSCSKPCKQPAFDVVISCPRYETSAEWLEAHPKKQHKRTRQHEEA